MNTILHLTGVLSALWASLFAYGTLNEPALGGALLILFFGFVVMTIAAVDDDLFLITGRKVLGFRGDQREAISMASKLAAVFTVVLLFISTFNVTGAGASDVNIVEPSTAFGEVTVAEMTPLVQMQFVYGANPRLVQTITGGSGTTSTANSVITVSTGTTIGSHEHVESVAHAKNYPGQGRLARWTALYPTGGVATGEAIAGIGNDEDGLFFGFEGIGFGILHRSDGRYEYQELAISNGATIAGGTITITLDGVATEVEVVNGDSPQAVVRAIVATAFTQWDHDADGAEVIYYSHLASDKTGLFSLVDTDSTGVVGVFTELVQGVVSTDDWIPQTDWNVDNLDGDDDGANPSGMLLDTTLGNVYQVQFQWLGFGEIRFRIENPATGRLIIVHRIKYTNSQTMPSLQNPTLPMFLGVDNGSTGFDIKIQASSMAVFVEGRINPATEGVASSAIGTASGDITTETPLLCVRGKRVFQGVENRVAWIPKVLSFSAAGTGGAKFTTLRVTINPIIGGDPVFNDLSTATSILETDTLGTTLTGGAVVGSFEFGASVENFVLDLEPFTVKQEPGTTVCFSAQTDGGSSDVDVGLIMRELF